jgi:hypothetical protein
MEALKRSTGEALQKYVDLARKFGLAAEYRFDLGTDIVETAFAIQQELRWKGIMTIILPVRINI